MEVFIHRKTLLASLLLVGKATHKGKHGVKPILACVKIVAADHGDSLTLSATNLEVGIFHAVRGATVRVPGAVCVNVGQLVAALKGEAGDDVLLRLTEAGLVVHGNVSESTLPVEWPADDFPDIPAFTAEEYHTVEADRLARMLSLTTPFVARESGKFAVSGTRLELNGKLVVVGTDCHRLGLIEGVCIKVGDPKDSEVTIPICAADLVEAMCKSLFEPVRVAVKWYADPDASVHSPEPIMRPREVWFQTADTTIYSRLMEGRYVPYREVFPKSTPHTAQMPAGALAASLKQVAASCDEESRRVTFAFGGGLLALLAQSPTRGAAKTAMPVQGDAVCTIAFDPKYVLQMLAKFGKKDVVTVRMTDGNRPAVFSVGDYKHLIMPIGA